MSNVLDGREVGKVHEDLAAERAVLGAVLADNTLMASVAEVVHSDDFSSPRTRRSSPRCWSWTPPSGRWTTSPSPRS